MLAVLLDDEAARSHLFSVALLLALRVLPLVLLSPLLGLGAAPRLVSLLLGLALTLTLLPTALLHAQADLTLAPSLLLLGLPELARGVLFAWAVALPLHAFSWTASLADALRGAELTPAFTTPEAEAPLGLLYRFAALSIFFAAGGHLLVLSSFADTLQHFPLGQVPTGLLPALLSAAQLFGKALSLALVLSAPVILCLFVVALATGLLSRIAQPVVTQLVQGPLRPVLGLAVIGLTASLVLPEVPLALRVFVSEAATLLRIFG